MDALAEQLAEKLRTAKQCLICTPKDLDAVVAEIDATLNDFEFEKSIRGETRELKS